MSKKPEIINIQAAREQAAALEKFRQQNDQDELDLSVGDASEAAGIHALVDIVEMILGAANMDQEFADIEKQLCDRLESAAAVKVLWTTIDDAAFILGRLGT